MGKDRDELAEEETRVAGMWGGAGASRPLWARLSPQAFTRSPTRKLPTLHFWDFVVAPSRRRGQSLTPFPALVPSRERGGRTASSKLLTTACSLWRPAPIQEPPSHLVRTKDTPVTQGVTRVSGVLCQEGTRRWDKRCSWCSCHLGIPRVPGAPGREVGVETSMYFLLSHGM